MGILTRFSDVRLAGVALLSKRAQGGTGKRIEGVKRGVQDPMGLARRCCFLALLPLLYGCTRLEETFEVAPFLREQITGDTWRACLAREYQVQAKSEVRAGRHWAEASRLAAKGRAALENRDVAPDPPPPDAELSGAHARLTEALVHRNRNPCDCATMQARYDGWLTKSARGANVAALPELFDEAAAACAASR